MSGSDTSQSSRRRRSKKRSRKDPTPPAVQFVVPCLCTDCTKPFSEPVKFVFVDRTPRDYEGRRKQATVNVMANILIGCLVMFFYFLFLYFTVGQRVLDTEVSVLMRHRHIYLGCIGAALGLGGGIMALCPTYTLLGWGGRRFVHFVMTVSGSALYIFGGVCVYLYDPFYVKADYTDWRVYPKILEQLDWHRIIGVFSGVLMIVSFLTGPVACLPFNITKFIHGIIGCAAFVSSMGSIFTALLYKKVTDMIDKWEMYHIYYDTAIVAALLIVLVVIKPITKFYKFDYKD